MPAYRHPVALTHTAYTGTHVAYAGIHTAWTYVGSKFVVVGPTRKFLHTILHKARRAVGAIGPWPMVFLW
jgi:hypothetical protein